MSRKNILKLNKGITLVSLVVTIVVMAILAGISIKATTGSKGLINQAKDAKSAAEKKDIEDKIDLAIVKVAGKTDNITMDAIIQQLIKDGIISDESQVDTETGTITLDDFVFKDKLANYISTNEEEAIIPTGLSVGDAITYSPSGTYTWKAEYASSDLTPGTGDVTLSSASGQSFNITSWRVFS